MKVSVPRDNPMTRNLATMLEAQGYSVEFAEPLNGRRLIDYTYNFDGICFVWQGHWRKVTGNRWQHMEHIRYMEQGYLPHYESIAISDRPLYIANLLDIELARALPNAPRCAYWDSVTPRNSYTVPVGPPWWMYCAQLERDSVIQFDAHDEHRSIVANVAYLLDRLPSGYRLVVKLHPRDETKHALPNDSRLHVISGPADPAGNLYLLRHCACMWTVNSSMIFEAMAAPCRSIHLLGQEQPLPHTQAETAALLAYLTATQITATSGTIGACI